LWQVNPYCYYCNCLTVLTNIQSGIIPDNAATIEHLISRLDPKRWTKRNSGEVRKVLACWKCNREQSYKEMARLTKEEIALRSNGFSLNPKGNPNFVKTKQNLEQVLAVLHKKGIDIKDGRVILRLTMQQKLTKWAATFLYALVWNVCLNVLGMPVHNQWLYNYATQ
jgi:hypothetical protein